MSKPTTSRQTTFDTWRQNTNVISDSVGDITYKTVTTSATPSEIALLATHQSETIGSLGVTNGSPNVDIGAGSFTVRAGMLASSAHLPTNTSVVSINYATGAVIMSQNFTTTGTTSVTFTPTLVSAVNDLMSTKLNKSGDTVVGNFLVNGNTTLGDAIGDTVTFNAKAVSVPNSLSIGADLMYIDSTNNRIGIRTATPQASLNVITAPTDVTNNVRGIALEQNDSSAALSQAKFIGTRTRGTTADPRRVTTNDAIVSLSARGYYAVSDVVAGAYSNTNGGFYVYAAEPWTASAQGTYASLRGVAIGGTAVEEFIRITSTTTTINSNQASTTSSTGALVVVGGVGIGGAVNVGGASTLTGNVTISGASTFTTGTGAVALNGNTSVSGTNALTVGTGLTTLGGALTVTGTADFNGAVTIDGANVSATISPTGTGTVTIAPATAGNINNMNIGVTTRGTGAFTTLVSNSTTTFSGTTSVSGTNTFTVGTGLTSLGGALTVTGTADFNGDVTIDGANVSATISPTGTGTVTISPATAGNIDRMNIGATTRGTGAFTTLATNSTTAFSGATSVTGTNTFTVGGITTLTSGTSATSTVTGTLVVTGGVGVSENAWVGGTLNAAGQTSLTAAITSTSATTGTLKVVGGVGVSENAWVGGTLNVAAATTLQGNTTISGTSTFSVGTGLSSFGGALTVTNTTTLNGVVSIAGANVTTTISPSGTGTVTIAPVTTAGNINNMNIGATTRGTGAFTTLASNSTTTFSGTTSVSGTNTFTVGTGATALGGTLTVTGLTTLNGAVTISPGVGAVTIAPTSTGNINNMNIGGTTRGTGAFTALDANGAITLGDGTADIITTNGTLNFVTATGKLKVDGVSPTNGILTTDDTTGTPKLRTISTPGNTIVVAYSGSNIELSTSGTMPAAVTFQDDVTFGDAADDRIVLNSYVDGPLHMGTSAGGGVLADILTNTTSSTSTGAGVVVSSLAHATYRTVEYLVQVSNGTSFYSSKILAMHNGTDVSITEYGNIQFGAWTSFTITAAINGANLDLSYSSAPAGTSVTRVVATSIRV